MEERLFDDYRRVDQVMEPHRIEWHRNGETFRITVERVIHNAPIDDTVFDVPAPENDPPLDVDAVLSAAARNERPVDDALASYAYSTTSTAGRIDKDGRVTEEEGASYEVFHLGGRPVARLVRKRGGQPLSEAERQAEDERVNNLVREYEQQRSSPSATGRPQAARPSSGFVIVRMPLMTSDWLSAYRRMSDFSNIRRERLRERAVLVVEFRPKPGVAPKTDFERQTRAMAGTLWIDEASQHVIRMESYFCDDYERTVQGSSVRVERVLVNDEVWLPSRTETNHTLSFAFGTSARFIGGVQYADHKKFNVATDSTVTLPETR